MDTIETPGAPRPGGHYSQAVVHGGLVYAAGQLPVDPATGEVCCGEVEDQARQAIANLRAVLRAAGSGLERTLKVTIYVADIVLWERVNAVYAEEFGAHRPARTVVPTPNLHHGALLEIDAIAALRGASPAP